MWTMMNWSMWIALSTQVANSFKMLIAQTMWKSSWLWTAIMIKLIKNMGMQIHQYCERAASDESSHMVCCNPWLWSWDLNTLSAWDILLHPKYGPVTNIHVLYSMGCNTIGPARKIGPPLNVLKKEERLIQAFENKCFMKLWWISWTRKITNIVVCRVTNANCALLNHIKTHVALCWPCNKKSKDTIEGYVLTALVSWLDNIAMWSGISGSDLFLSVCTLNCHMVTMACGVS